MIVLGIELSKRFDEKGYTSLDYNTGIRDDVMNRSDRGKKTVVSSKDRDIAGRVDQ